MRINLIGNFRTKGLMQDSMILRGLLVHVYGEKVEIRKVQHALPDCADAELNIFIEVMNPCLISRAAKNIWIPNPEWVFKTWYPYLKMVDEVWVKTREAEELFKDMCNVRYIGWTSLDKARAEKKNYSKAIMLVGKNIYRNPKQTLKAYLQLKNSEIYKSLPHLYIPYNADHVQFYVPEELSDKITLLNKELSDEEYNSLLDECGLAICTSACEGFGHAVNEAMSSGCNLILSPIEPFRELTKEAIWTESLQTIAHPECSGNIIDVSVPSIINSLTNYAKTSLKQKQQTSNNIRIEYEQRHSAFLDLMKPLLESQPISEYSLDSKLPKEEELPDISIVTLTRDRRVFMPLAHYSYMIQSYPEDKLEWVIVDDGDDPIEDTLLGISNVKYVRCDSKMTIGQKRNLGVQNAMYDVLAMVDDDDVYPNNSILHRAAMMLMLPQKECVFCTTIPCYDITKYSSFINVPPNTLPMAQRVSEATLMFTRKFWQDRNFPDIQVAEGDAFVQGREQMCREISPQEVIVSLIHPKNTSSRKIPDIPEPNGCHYGFNEKLFAVVSEIGEALKAHAEEGLTATTVALGGTATAAAT
jgi:hypothetical protein